MNILMITEQFLFGGLETQIREQIDYLVKSEHRVYLAVGRFSNQSISDLKLSGIIRGLNIGLESKGEDLIKTVDLISGFVEKNNINIIHAHPFLSLLPAFLVAVKTHVPMVITLHGPVSLKSSIGFGNLYDKLLRTVILPYVNHVFCVSEEMRSLAKLYVKEENLTILRNAVSLSLFKSARRKNDGPWALISRLDRDKIEGVIQFILMAEKAGINYIHLFGDGYERASLERFVSENTKNMFIEFKGECNNLNEVLVEGYFGIAGMGRVVLEGAALNLPTILVGYDGVKGLSDERLMENAKWWNYSGRGLPNVDDHVLTKTLMELQSNIDKYLLRNWSEVNANSDNIWSKYLKTIMELDANQNEFQTELLELFKAHIGSNKPFLFDRDLYFDIEDSLIKYSIGSRFFAEKRITSNAFREERDEALIAKARIEQDRQRLLKDNEIIEQDKQRLLKDNETIEQDRQRLLKANEIIEQDRQRLLTDSETIERDRQRLLKDNEIIEQDRQRLSMEIAVLEKNIQLQKKEINRIVGIVILNYNTAEITKITIDSLIKAKNRVSYEICLIDNASNNPDVILIENYFNEKILQNEVAGSFIRNTTNLGFAGGNNVGISNFLNSPGISYICLLNSDVIVTDWWLDNLLDLHVEAVGPVSNAVGNEQTVIPDYSVEKDFNAFDIVNTFAVNWYKKWKGSVSQTDFLGFFAVLFSRKLIEAVGLLDTRFYPGSYEDDDYCIRIINSGYKMYIARDVYLHHYGSGSFSKLTLEHRISISDENKKRFENKWGRKWEDRTFKIVESGKLETIYILNNITEGNKYIGYIDACYDGIKVIVKRIVNHNVHLEEKVQELQNYIKLLKDTSNRETPLHHKEMEISLNIILHIIKKKLLGKLGISRVKGKMNRIICDAISKLNLIRKRSRNLKNKIAPPGFKRLILLIIKKWNVCKLLNFRKVCICIFAPLFNEERLKDGYFRRVKAVDDIIGDKILKIYCCTEYHEKSQLIIKYFEDNRVYVAYNPDSRLQQIQILIIVFITGRIYVHSVLQLMKKAFYLPFVEKLIDLHGAVPEEFRLHNDYLNGQLFDEKEELAVRKANVLITVTDSMKRHILKKYLNKVKGEIIIMPIFDDDISVDAGKSESGRPYENGKAIITYAGGVHKWQMIPLMQDVMLKVQEVVYRIFVPSPAQYFDIWGSRPMINNMLVESKTPNELPPELDKCHFGFVLREEIAVNSVACPTKLIEYIQHGIVPIMHSPKVGDFQKLGMNYLSLDDLINLKIPDETKRLIMANENRQVLIKLRDLYDSGKRRLLEWIGSNE